MNTLSTSGVSTFQQQEDSHVISQGIVNSPKISQVTGDSPELTAMEKTTTRRIT